jgi:hypothetical protein
MYAGDCDLGSLSVTSRSKNFVRNGINGRNEKACIIIIIIIIIFCVLHINAALLKEVITF